MKPTNLSKSTFAAGCQCGKRLWIEKRMPALLPEISAAQQAIFDQGHEVGAWSHRLFPDGILLSGELDFAAHLEASRDALKLRRPLFEPAFSIPGAYARADILVPVEVASWDLLEVKSASNVWGKQGEVDPVYLQDVAFQLHVYRMAGVAIRRAVLVFLDRDYVRRGDVDPSRLFRQVDITPQAEALLPTIPAELARLAALLQVEEMPTTAIGPHCDSPYPCSVRDYCWRDVPADSVFSLTRAGKRAFAWWHDGIVRVADLPADGRYSTSQSVQIAAARTGQLHVDRAVLEGFLSGLTYPLAFLDFETVMPAVPPFDGFRPYGQVPFQFSLHIQPSEGGDLVHYEYLADGKGDPRPGFLNALRAALGKDGSIVCYNSGFETQRLKELAIQFPEHAGWIHEALPRFVGADIWKPFQAFAVYHPAQHGSASLKAVLPAFTDLGYEGLVIREGGTASFQFLNLLKGSIAIQDQGALRDALLAYCFRDTIAMVKLLEKLRELAGSKVLGNQSERLTVAPEGQREPEDSAPQQLVKNEGENHGSN
jgi:hypothetical protein